MILRKFAFGGVMALALAACAAAPRLEVATHGSLEGRVSPSFAMAGSGAAVDDGAGAPRAVAAALEAAGWRPERAEAAWQVEAVYARRPVSVGGFTEDTAPAETDAWRIRPQPRRWWRRDRAAHVLEVRVVDVNTGAELIRAQGRLPGDGPPTGQALNLLAEAVVAGIVAPPAGDQSLRGS